MAGEVSGMNLDQAQLARAKAAMRAKGKAQEIPEDVVPYGEQREQQLAAINARRAVHGLPPFPNDEQDNPELTEQRRQHSERYWNDEKRRSRERTQKRSGISVRR